AHLRTTLPAWVTNGLTMMRRQQVLSILKRRTAVRRQLRTSPGLRGTFGKQIPRAVSVRQQRLRVIFPLEQTWYQIQRLHLVPVATSFAILARINGPSTKTNRC